MQVARLLCHLLCLVAVTAASSLIPGKLLGYYTSWSIYQRNFQPSQIPAQYLSHLVYAFFNVSTDGTVFPGDYYADIWKMYPNDVNTTTGPTLHGNLNQIYQLKRQYRGMKVMLGIGGAAGSTNLSAVAANAAARTQFAMTAVEAMLDLGMDGIMIDWEFPASLTDGENFAWLLYQVREVLNASYQYMRQTDTTSPPFILGASFSGDSAQLSILPLAAISVYLDIVNLMCYDYVGAWSPVTGNQAQWFGTGIRCLDAMIAFENAQVPRSKIIIGVPAYGRSFEATTFPSIGQTFSGVGPGEWQPGIWDYKAIVAQNVNVTQDPVTYASVAYNTATRELISYDTDYVVAWKTDFARSMWYGGMSIWEMSGDSVGQGSLLYAMRGVMDLTTGGTDATQNRLNYTVASRFVNVRAGS